MLSKNLKKRIISLLAVALIAPAFSVLTIESAQAVTTTMADPTNSCQLNLTSSSMTLDTSVVDISVTGIYCVAQFKGVGTYTAVIPSYTTSIDYLVVAGGGGGGSGGGGAGGVRQENNFAVTPSSPINISVGGGGTGGNGGNVGSGVSGGRGENSSLGTITSLGGGGGSSARATFNGDGGSGGGSSWDCVSPTCRTSGGTIDSRRAGTGTPGQGNNGGYSTYNSYGAGGGGGGAGGPGYNTTRLYVGAHGGIGVQSSITGVAKYYGGGGGGGVNNNDNKYVAVDASGVQTLSVTPVTTGGGQGGLGGGGRGTSYGYTGATTQGANTNATPGEPNTGGGGGGTDPEDINGQPGGSGIVVMRWVAAANLKLITFDVNLGASETTTQRVIGGYSTQLRASTFSRSGYVFQGWNTAANGSGSSYSNAAMITTNSDVTLYAQWQLGVNHIVTFDPNLGSGTMASQEAGLATALFTNTFTRASYVFNGWNTAADGSGYSYQENDTYLFNADMTLYAQWAPAGTASTVSFYGNGATGGSTPSQTKSGTTALTLNGYSKTGYAFLGWNPTYNATTAIYLDGENYNFSADLNLYAIWVVQTSNSVTFDGNGADVGSSTPSQTASASTVLNANGFTRSGYTFIGWNTRADGTGVNYSSGYTYSFATGVTLYARWSQNFTISYAGNTSESGTVPVAQTYYAGGPRLTVATNTGNLRKAGYTLIGWNTAANGSGTSYALGGTNATFSSNTTLYAQWTGTTYYILYNDNAATSGSAPARQSYVNGGATLTLYGNTGTLAKTGYTFSGWNTASDGTGTNYAAAATGQTFSADTVLFAKWTPIQYTMLYYYNRGTVETTTATFSYGGSTTLPSPTRTGYGLDGWYDASSGGTKIGNGGTVYNTASSATLYAHWTLSSYLVTYDLQGGSGDTSTVTFNFGDPAHVLRTPTRTSYHFDGWYNAATAGTKIGDAGANFTPTAATTLYARWTQLSLVGLDSATKIGSITTTAGVGNSFGATTTGTTVSINYQADALPPATVIDVWAQGGNTRATSLLPVGTNILLSLVVAWKASDDTVPNTAAGKPISMVITNSSIKTGAKIYSLLDSTSTLIGTATTDGSVTVTFDVDPEIVIANPVTTSGGGSGGGGGGGGSVIIIDNTKILDDKKAAEDKKRIADLEAALAEIERLRALANKPPVVAPVEVPVTPAVPVVVTPAKKVTITGTPQAIKKALVKAPLADSEKAISNALMNALIATKYLTLAKTFDFPTNPDWRTIVKVKNPRTCSATGSTVKRVQYGSCVVTYTTILKSGSKLVTTKAIGFYKLKK